MTGRQTGRVITALHAFLARRAQARHRAMVDRSADLMVDQWRDVLDRLSRT